MATSVQAFKKAAIDKLRLESESAGTLRLTEEERARNEGERSAAAEQQAHVVHSLATGLERLSSGDLLFRLTDRFAPEYDKLRIDFNGAMEQLQETMRTVSTNTSAIRSGTDGISLAADDLSKRTEQQAASLEQTAAALDEITATVRKTAEGASHGRQVVGSAKSSAEHSGQVVRQAIEAMSGIEKSSGQINQIIGVIDEIAFQTNLLALNAGVKAARAGDAGRGFAVVASEVRALAQRSAEAAKEIKALISASGTHVAHRQRHRDLGSGTSDGARPGQHGRQPDGSGHSAKRVHGRAIDRREPCPGAGNRRTIKADQAVPSRPGFRASGARRAQERHSWQAGIRGQASRCPEKRRARGSGCKARANFRTAKLGGILTRTP